MKIILFKTRFYEYKQTRGVDWYSIFMLNNEPGLIYFMDGREHTEYNITYFEVMENE